MPVIDLSEDELTNNPRFSAIKVMAVMVFPDNERLREEFLVSVAYRWAAQQAHMNGLNLVVDASCSDILLAVNNPARQLDDALPAVVEGSVKTPGAPRMTGGGVAGSILLHAIRQKIGGNSNIGLKECIAALSNQLQSKAGRAKRARPQDLKTHWHRFAPVAHLWAAVEHISRSRALPGGEQILAWDGLLPTERPQLAAFLATAETFRELGQSIRHRNAQATFLRPDDMWMLAKEFEHLRLPDLGQNFCT